MESVDHTDVKSDAVEYEHNWADCHNCSVRSTSRKLQTMECERNCN